MEKLKLNSDNKLEQKKEVTIKFKRNLREDAWNWWDACNSIGHGVDWKQRISPELQAHIVGKTKKEAFKFLLPYLKKYYKEHETELIAYSQGLEKKFVAKKDDIFTAMAKTTGHKIYLQQITCLITTFPRSPYDYRTGTLYLGFHPKMDLEQLLERQVAIFIHELLHFQFHHYYEKKVRKYLSKNQFEYLKEAMTVIIQDEFKKIVKGKEKGYAIHHNLRTELLKLWREDKNFNKFVAKGMKLVKKTVK